MAPLKDFSTLVTAVLAAAHMAAPESAPVSTVIAPSQTQSTTAVASGTGTNKGGLADLQITSMALTVYPNSSATWDSIRDSISFTVVNPGSLSNSHATCSGVWSAKGSPPTTYVQCSTATHPDGSAASGSSFVFRFGDAQEAVPTWNSVTDFGLTVSNSYKNPKEQPPYDSMRVFTRIAVTGDHLDCSTSDYNGGFSTTQCNLKPGVTLDLPIYAQS